MPKCKAMILLGLFVWGAAVPSGPAHAVDGPVTTGVTLPDNDVMMRALADELARSMNELTLEGLPQPYFIQYHAWDRLAFSLDAAYGGLVGSDEDRFRTVRSLTRAGSYELDNTHFRASSGARAYLPIDDDYDAIRHAVWSMTDRDYKRTVEVLARKRAYLEDKNVVDRPDDFSPAELASEVEPSASVVFDERQWRDHVKQLSGRFAAHPRIQDSAVRLHVSGMNEWIVNSEGARLRMRDGGVSLRVEADIQASDGMFLADSRSYPAETVDQLPPIEKILSDIDEMSEKLIALSEAPVLEHYDGPVLFEPRAAGMMFEALFAYRLCAAPMQLGNSYWTDESLEKKIGRRVLPQTFTVVDDPGPRYDEDTYLVGSYRYDNEAVRAQRVTLVEDGILQTLLAGRAPTRKIKQSTGHARSGRNGAEASIGCLYVSDANGMTADELKQALIQAARDEGIEFGLRVVSMEGGGAGWLGDPVYAYKVYVEDGREELVRGIEFLPIETRELKRILAAGVERKVYNSTGRPAVSIISPAVLFEEIELTRIEEEHDKLPILESPATRNFSLSHRLRR